MILIVEDNRAVRKMIRSLVEDLGNEVCECDDGAQALSAFEIYQPDWVLMDLAMRQTDGLSATRRIIAQFPDAKIAIVTSHDDDGLRRAARAAGALEYVSKDNLTDLRRVLAH